jgi:hypothetical protein
MFPDCSFYDAFIFFLTAAHNPRGEVYSRKTRRSRRLAAGSHLA